VSRALVQTRNDGELTLGCSSCLVRFGLSTIGMRVLEADGLNLASIDGIL